MLDLKLGQIKTEIKDELVGTVREMLAEAVEGMKNELKEEVDHQITNRLEEHVPDPQGVVTASTTIVREVVLPEMEQRMVSKVVNEVKQEVKNDLETSVEVVKRDLKSEMDQSLTGLTQQINTQVKEKSEELSEQISTRISETEKIVFAASSLPSTTDKKVGDITFGSIIEDSSNSFDKDTGIFRVTRSGTYQFNFLAWNLWTNDDDEVQFFINGVSNMTVQYWDRSDGDDKDKMMTGSSWVAKLQSGDEIKLRITSGGLCINKEKPVNFSGFFLSG